MSLLKHILFALVLAIPAQAYDGTSSAGTTNPTIQGATVMAFPPGAEPQIAGLTTYSISTLEASAQQNVATIGDTQKTASLGKDSLDLARWVPMRIRLSNTQEVSGVYKLTDGSPIKAETAKALLSMLQNRKDRETAKEFIMKDITNGVKDPKLSASLEEFIDTTTGLLSTALPSAEQLLNSVGTYNQVVASANLAYLSDPPETFLAYQFILTLFTTSAEAEPAEAEPVDTVAATPEAAASSYEPGEYYEGAAAATDYYEGGQQY